MRQIDNMTPQEIETLHLKGMLADNKAKPVLSAMLDASESFAPNKAQHSPLPDEPSIYADLVAAGREIANDSKCDLVYSERRIRLYSALEKLSAFNPSEHPDIRRVIRERDKAKSHADKLAEACKEALIQFGANADYSEDDRKVVNQIRTAVQAYEAAQ